MPKIWHLDSTKEILLIFENNIFYPIFVGRRRANCGEFKEIFTLGQFSQNTQKTQKQQSRASV